MTRLVSVSAVAVVLYFAASAHAGLRVDSYSAQVTPWSQFDQPFDPQWQGDTAVLPADAPEPEPIDPSWVFYPIDFGPITQYLPPGDINFSAYAGLIDIGMFPSLPSIGANTGLTVLPDPLQALRHNKAERHVMTDVYGDCMTDDHYLNPMDYANSRTDSTDAHEVEFARYAKVVNQAGVEVVTSAAYADMSSPRVDETGFEVAGRVTGASEALDLPGADIYLSASGDSSLTSTYALTRDAQITLRGSLARGADTDLTLTLNGNTDRPVLTFTPPASGEKFAFELTGLLGPGTYTLKVAAEAAVYSTEPESRYEVGQYELDFAIAPLLDDEQFIAAALAGELSLDQLKAGFAIDNDDVRSLVAHDQLPQVYLDAVDAIDALESTELPAFLGSIATLHVFGAAKYESYGTGWVADGASITIPEPATATIIIAALLLTARRSRRA